MAQDKESSGVEESRSAPTLGASNSKSQDEVPEIKVALKNPSIVAASLAFLLLIVLFSTGWVNVLLVLLCSILLLLNPWVRTFFELPSAHTLSITGSDKSRFSLYDPARLLHISPVENASNGKTEGDDSLEDVNIPAPKQMVGQAEAYAALRRMPPALRTPIADLEELIIRDFISTWYNFHSFADQSLQNQARYSIDYAVGSAYAAMEYTRSADVVSEVLLTVSSVLLTTLRTRRLYPGRAAIFSSNTARISALKEAMDRLLRRHSKRQDMRCDLLRILLVEILSKQLWNAICSIGEPDFINRKIIEWGEAQRAKESGQPDQAPSTWQNETHLHAPSPQQSRRSSANPSPAPSQLGVQRSASASRAHSPALERLQVSSSDSAAPRSPTVASSSRLGSASSEPLTMQPRAMVMPVLSPSINSPSVDRSTFPSTVSTPNMHAPPLPRRPPTEKSASTEHPIAIAPTPNSSLPPQLPPRKEIKPPEPTKQDEMAWSFMAMDIPPEANQGMVLPESIQRSIRKPAPDATKEVEGYRLSGDSRRIQNASDPTSAMRASSGSYDAGPSSLQSSNDSQSYRVRSRPSSRPASSASGGIPPAPDLAEVLLSTDSAGLIALRDAFEAFLERGGAASRSLFFSPPSAATVAPGEGLALLKLHVGLSTLSRLIPNEKSDEGEVYREDAYNVAVKALRNLRQVDDSIAGRPLREALLVAAQRLRNVNDGRVREVMRPVESTLWTRLSALYDHFWKETCTRPAGSRPPIASPSLSGSGRPSFASSRRTSEEKGRPSMDQLHYQPRKKTTNNAHASAPMSAENSHNGTEGMSTTRRDSMTAASPLVQHTEPDCSPELEHRRWLKEDMDKERQAPPSTSRRDDLMPSNEGDQSFDNSLLQDSQNQQEDSSLAPSESFIDDPEPLPTIEITVADVSPNADRPTSIVDIRTYEFMIAVEGLVAGGGGFVLLRTWRDLQQLDEQLRITTSSSFFDMTLPEVKGQSSETLTKAIEAYLVKLLSTPSLVDTEAVQYFVDKTRAGEPPSDRSSVLRDSLRLSNRGLGLRNIANGMGAVGKNAFNTLQMMPGSMGAMRNISSRDIIGDAGVKKEGINYNDGPRRSGANLKEEPLSVDIAQASPLPPSSPHLPPQQTRSQRQSTRSNTELSPQELDNLLSCFFAIADEAFNLSGGWTLRRGLLRVLEQVVRTQYWTSIMGMFQNVSHSLNQEQMGLWLTNLTDMFWPDDAKIKEKTVHLENSKRVQREGTIAEKLAWEEDEKRAEIAAEVLAEAVGASGAEEVKEERSQEEKWACHLKAKSIIIAQTPVGSAYFLGPGGKQSCEKALNLLHEEICNPETSLDLVLAVVLKLCDIEAR